MNIFRNKKFLFAFVLCITIAGVFLFVPGIGFAEEKTPPKTSNEGAGIAGFIGKLLVLPVISSIAAVLYLIQSALVYVLWIAAGFFNDAFWWNIMLFPSNMLVVLKGWTVLRDIANAFFILIILWIALTLIFNSETLGGKKLLVRVLAVALLINFSLTFVTFIFGIANVLATSIAEKMPDDIGGYIINELRLHTIFRASTPEEISDYVKKSDEFQGAIEAESQKAQAGGFIKSRMFANALKGSIGGPVHEAEAISSGQVVGVVCGAGAIVGIVATVASSGAASAAFPFLAKACGWSLGFYSLFQVGGSLLNFGFAYVADFAIQRFISILFLSLTILAMFRAAFALLIRIIIEILLAISAPAAFLFAVFPGKITTQYWNMWLSYLFRWAFFAPIFYFLLYLALLMIQNPATFSGKPKPPIAGFDIDSLLQITLPLILIWIGVNFARKTGGAIAQTVIDYGKKYGKRALMVGAAVASGGASLAAGKAVAGLATAKMTGTERITGAVRNFAEKRPWVSRAAGPLLRGTTEYLEKRREAVDKYQSRIQSRSPDDVAIDFRTRAPTLSPEARIADVRRLGELNKLELLSEKEIRETITLSKQYGLEQEFAKLRPDLAVQVGVDIRSDEAKSQIHTIVEKMKTEEVPHIDLRTLGGHREEGGTAIDISSARGREQLEKEHNVRETIIREVFLTGDSEKLSAIIKAITRLPAALRGIYKGDLTDVLRTQQNWNTLEAQNPIMHAQIIQYIASNPGQRAIAGFELPQETKQKLEEIREQQRGRKKRQAGGGE